MLFYEIFSSIFIIIWLMHYHIGISWRNYFYYLVKPRCNSICALIVLYCTSILIFLVSSSGADVASFVKFYEHKFVYHLALIV